MKGQRRESGVALVMVLWLLLLITISTSAYTLMARMDQLEAHTVLWSTEARLAAEAGINLGVLNLRDPEDENRWIADGRPYQIQYRDAIVEIRFTDERGKIDLNTIDEESLQRLFVANELDEEEAHLLASALMDWVDEDNMVRPDGAEEEEYASAGYQVGPGNRKFIMVAELLQVLGMPWELYQKIEPGLTVWSDESGLPDPAFGPTEALLALPDMTREEVVDFVTERQSRDATDGSLLTLPNGQSVVASGPGLTYSIVSKATLPNGVWDQVEATIRLGGTIDGLPFKILSWKEGFHH